MRKTLILALLCSLSGSVSASAQNTWAGNSAEDYAEMQDACRTDAYRFCGGNTIFIFEMENCLKRQLPRLTKRCRLLLTPTDFRKYYRNQSLPVQILEDLQGL